MKAAKDPDVQTLTEGPQPLGVVMDWVLSPSQAGTCDVLVVNGQKFGVLAPEIA
jgi:hypothetical protein